MRAKLTHMTVAFLELLSCLRSCLLEDTVAYAGFIAHGNDDEPHDSTIRFRGNKRSRRFVFFFFLPGIFSRLRDWLRGLVSFLFLSRATRTRPRR